MNTAVILLVRRQLGVEVEAFPAPRKEKYLGADDVPFGGKLDGFQETG